MHIDVDEGVAEGERSCLSKVLMPMVLAARLLATHIDEVRTFNVFLDCLMMMASNFLSKLLFSRGRWQFRESVILLVLDQRCDVKWPVILTIVE